MRYFLTAIIILLATSAFAELYIWTDEKGVRHIGNFAPPSTAKDVKVGDEITKTEAQRNAEIEYNRKRRERIYAIPEKKHTKKRSYSSNLPINATRAAKQKSTYTSTRSGSDSAYIEELKKKAEQWYPGKDKDTSGWSQERRLNALHDPRRLEAVRAQRALMEIYSGSTVKRNKSVEEYDDKYWKKGKTEEQNPKPLYDKKGILYTPLGPNGYTNTKTGDFHTKTGSHELLNTRTGEYKRDLIGFDD